MKQVSLNRSLLLSAIALTIGTQALTAQTNTLSTTADQSFWTPFSVTASTTLMPAQGQSVAVPNNEYELTVDYKLNNRHTLGMYNIFGHNLTEKSSVDKDSGIKTIDPTFYVAAQTEFYHMYQITSPRIKNLSIKSKLSYAAPTTEDDIDKNHGGWLQARMQFHFLLNNQTINLGLRPYIRKHIVSNVIWEEGVGDPPVDFQAGNWFVANFNLTSKLSFENFYNLRFNFPVRNPSLTAEEAEANKIPEDAATVKTSSNYYSWLRYAFNGNVNAFLHYRNERGLIERNQYAVDFANEQSSVFGIGAEVSF